MQNSLYEMALEPESADLVISNAFLEHVPDCERAIECIGRMTRSGGYSMHSIDGFDHDHYVDGRHPLDFLKLESTERLVGTGGCNRVRPLEFVPLFQRHGFDILEVKRWSHGLIDVSTIDKEQLAAPFRDLPDEMLDKAHNSGWPPCCALRTAGRPFPSSSKRRTSRKRDGKCPWALAQAQPTDFWAREQLYDLRRDPGEISPLADPEATRTMEQLRALAAEHAARSLAKNARLETERTSPELAPEARERLRALGYVTDEPEQVFSFLEHLERATIVAPGDDCVTTTGFAVGGEIRPVLFERPDSEVTFHDLRIYPSSTLEFGIGINEEAWNRGGDGVRFEIIISASQSVERTVYSRYIDPKNRVEDRKWMDEVLDLRPFAGEVVSITFRTSSGPSNSRLCDWAGWSTPKLWF